MKVYYNFKSAKEFESLPIDGHFISVLDLKKRIFEKHHLGGGKDFDLVVTNAHTNEEYGDEAMLIPKHTSVLVRRVPARPCMPIVIQPVAQKDKPNVEAGEPGNAQPTKSKSVGVGSPVVKYPDDSACDESGGDLYANPEALTTQIGNPVQDAPPLSKADEENKIRALVNTPALAWHRQNVFGRGRGYGRGMGGSIMGGRGFGRGSYGKVTPGRGYVWNRCNQPGHFIHHCPTNGDPRYDIKTPATVLKPNEDANEKNVEGLLATRPAIEKEVKAAGDPITVKEQASQVCIAPLANKEVQQNQAAVSAGKKKKGKKKKKKSKVPSHETQWGASQSLARDNYLMSMGPAVYNPYWYGMLQAQPSYGGALPHFGGPVPTFMGYGPGDVVEAPFGLVPQNPFGVSNMMLPPPLPPRRDIAEMSTTLGMGTSLGPSTRSGEEFEAQKADIRTKREVDSSGERNLRRELKGGVSSKENVSSRRHISKPHTPEFINDQSHHHHRTDKPSPPPEHGHGSDYGHHHHKNKHHHHHHSHHRFNTPDKSSAPKAPSATSTAEVAKHHHKSSVFSRISFSAQEQTENRLKTSPQADKAVPSWHGDGHKNAVEMNKAAGIKVDRGFSKDEEERHFRRKRGRYVPLPAEHESSDDGEDMHFKRRR